MIGMAGFRGYLEYSKLLADELPYLASHAKNYSVTPAEANATGEWRQFDITLLFLVSFHHRLIGASKSHIDI
jgi:hypothetical protein